MPQSTSEITSQHGTVQKLKGSVKNRRVWSRGRAAEQKQPSVFKSWKGVGVIARPPVYKSVTTRRPFLHDVGVNLNVFSEVKMAQIYQQKGVREALLRKREDTPLYCKEDKTTE